MTDYEALIFDRVANWNSLRYERIYDDKLYRQLLAEELLELIETRDLIEQLDAIGDVYFVAYGGLWKRMQGHPGGMNSQTRYVLNYCAKELKRLSGVYDLETRKQLWFDIMTCICDSNDTKSVQKVSANVKANTDKGLLYVPPTEALKAVVRKWEQKGAFQNDL